MCSLRALFYLGWHDLFVGDLDDRTVTQVPEINHEIDVSSTQWYRRILCSDGIKARVFWTEFHSPLSGWLCHLFPS